MKKTILSLLIIALVSGLQGCTDLGEEVFSSLTESSYKYSSEDLSKSVAAPYSFLRGVLGHQQGWTLEENTTDEIAMPPNASGWDDGGIYRQLHYHSWTSELASINSFWNSCYGGVLLCTKVISQIEEGTIPANSDNEKKQAIAETRALRAFYYWWICDNFGDAPLIKEPTTELPSCSPRKDIYEFIISELKASIPDLSEEVGGKQYGRMNKWAAECLLANVYLNAEVYTGTPQWQACIDECNKIISSGKCELAENYKDNFKSQGQENCKEILFSIPSDYTYGGAVYFQMFSWGGQMQKARNLKSTPWGEGTACGITQFIDTYDTLDNRLSDTWLMGQQYSYNDGTPLTGTWDEKGKPLCYRKGVKSGDYAMECDGYRMNKYEVPVGSHSSLDTDFPVFRYSEVLLMKAECLLRLGKPGAGQLVTEVRQRNFKKNPSHAIVTDEMLKQNTSYNWGYVKDYKIVETGDNTPVKFGRMYDELGWEFAWEMHRRRDMIRFGTFTKKSWLSHKPNGEYRTVFPIPEPALTANKNLKQNSNYQNSTN